MTVYQQIEKDFKRLSSFTRSKSYAILSSPDLVLLSKEFQSSYSPAVEKEIREKLTQAYSENAEHLRKMVQRSGSLGRFHSVWLSENLDLGKMEKVLNSEIKLRSKEYSRLFNKKRRETGINREARTSLVMLQNGFSMEQIARGNRGMNNNSERIWRTESHQMYNQSVKNAIRETGGVLQAIEVLDEVTRQQSLFINGTLSDKEGRFLYPDGGKYVLSNSGQPQWDINDRGIAVPYIGGDIRKMEVEKDIPAPRSLAVELAKNIALDMAIKELFEILFKLK